MPDALHNRVQKTIVKNNQSTTKEFYIRDAQGNTLAVYEFFDNKLVWKEQHLYGAERIGTYMVEATLYHAATTTTDQVFELEKFEDNEKTKDNKWVALAHYVGVKRYEITNHLGNVLAVVTDRRLPGKHSIPGQVPTYWQAEVVQLQEYYVFGAKVPNRCWDAGEGYRYGFNGKETSDEIAFGDYDFGARIYSATLGRWMSVDPYYEVSPSESAYIFSGNSPIFFVDHDGLWKVEWINESDISAGIKIVAEAGDNFRTLASQMGVNYDGLIANSFGGVDYSLEPGYFYEGCYLTEADLPSVLPIKKINDYLQTPNIKNETNCANLALACNGLSSAPFTKDNGFESVPQATNEAKAANNITCVDAQIGDMIIYEMFFDEFVNFALSNGIQDAPGYKNSDGSMKSTKEMMPILEDLYKTKEDRSHFSILLLKDVSGTKIKQVLEKNGDSDVLITNGEGGVNQYEPKALPGDSSPIYDINNDN